MASNLFCEIDRRNHEYDSLANQLEIYGKRKGIEIYLLKFPKSDVDTSKMENEQCFLLLMPNHKVCIVNNDASRNDYEEYKNDVDDTFSYLFTKYKYRDYFKRYAIWSSELLKESCINEIKDIERFEATIRVTDLQQKKNVNLLIALAIGSINDIDRVKEDVPKSLLDKVKQKIQLFDADQTRFIYEQISKKVVRIQGLSGTGKTELLLHKLRELYIQKEKFRIFLTCHNNVLADSLYKRIPGFFNFMKVQEQIEWNERLWCTNAWGRAFSPDSGLYSYICDFYNIPFKAYNKNSNSFDKVCRDAIDVLKTRTNISPAFDYVLIDERQDFKESFIELCEMVTKYQVYVAGDVFQSIFSEIKKEDYNADYYLKKCYRTDPHTLLFAHALGFGLLEPIRFRWLDKDDWEACGFLYDEREGNLILSREPINRFDEIENYNSVEIKYFDEDIVQKIVETIREIQSQNPTAEPDDICIIFIDDGQYIYDCANTLSQVVFKTFGWDVNKTYETKERKFGKLSVSNKNNVKGLEFPFVICVTQKLQSNYIYRNVLYTMLTRSFIQSFLLVSKTDTQVKDYVEKGLEEILQKNQMTVKMASSVEQEEIGTRFHREKERKSLGDFIKEQVQILGVGKEKEKLIYTMLNTIDLRERSDDEIKDKISQVNKLLD